MFGSFVQRIALSLKLLRHAAALARQLLFLHAKLRELLAKPLHRLLQLNDARL
jgi:hypothetical protein